MMSHLQEELDVKITVVVSKAGVQVLTWYNLWDKINKRYKNVLKESNANAPFIAGALQIGKYDLLIVAPLTANSTAKIAHGIADTLITNTVAQTLKGTTPVLLYPVDQEEGEITTTGPDGTDFMIRTRQVDLENVRRLREMRGVTILRSPTEIIEIMKKNLEWNETNQ